MSDYVCLLITILYEDSDDVQTLLQCALKVKRDTLNAEVYIYPMEPEYRKILHSLLPLHVRNRGPIVDVEEIFEVQVVE